MLFKLSLYSKIRTKSLCYSKGLTTIILKVKNFRVGILQIEIWMPKERALRLSQEKFVPGRIVLALWQGHSLED